MIKDYIEMIVKKDNKEDMKKLSKMLSDVIYDIKDYSMDNYEKYKSCLYEMAYGKILPDEEKRKWVSQMKPQAKWSEEDIAKVIDDYDTNVPKMSLYVIMNMLYSDFKSVFGSGDEENSLKMYIQASSDWYFDEDTANTEESKLYTYYKYIIK